MSYTIEAKILQEFFGSIYLDEFNIRPTEKGWELSGMDTSGTLFQSLSLARGAFQHYEQGDEFRLLNQTIAKKMVDSFDGLVEITVGGGVITLSSLTREATLPLGALMEETKTLPNIPYQNGELTLPHDLLKRAVDNMNLVETNRLVMEIGDNQLLLTTASKKGIMEEKATIPTYPDVKIIVGEGIKNILPMIFPDAVELRLEKDLPITIKAVNANMINHFVIAHMLE